VLGPAVATVSRFIGRLVGIDWLPGAD